MVRGDTITIYPYAYDRNIKVSFFDKEVEEIRLTDRVDPTEFSKIKSFYLFNNSFLLDNIDKELFESNSNEFKNVLLIFSNDKEHLSKEDHVFYFDYAFPPIYLSHLELLRKDIQNYQEKGYEVYTNIDKEEIFGSVKVKHIDIDVSSGFIDNSSKILFLSEKEVFGNIKKVSTKKGDNFFDQNIKIGDYIVHEDYGIGIYKDIVKKNNEEYFLLEYAASDKLYVPLTQINKLTKYLGEGGIAPHITRLGKTEWEHIKSRVKKSVENIARELLLHFALQQSSEAKSFTSKTPMYEEMCNDFPYELTLDQEIAVKELNRDLASTKPMNRLLIGDVGFGKTEVALRAAFRVIEDGSQVALLAPTTILVYQHFNLFKERFEKFGIKVGMVSSFNTSKENTEILNRLEKKEIDLIIGTHRLLSKDVKIPKLALLIVDEEQRFGVKQKEKIKALRYGTHILTLSATPIPRTLSLALSKLQDLSVITTPPPGRKAVETYVHKLDIYVKEYYQVVPILSSIKVSGYKLRELTRNSPNPKVVKRKDLSITDSEILKQTESKEIISSESDIGVFDLSRGTKYILLPKRKVDIISYSNLKVSLDEKENIVMSGDIEVSSGTYIRKLVEDITENSLGIYSYLSKLSRIYDRDLILKAISQLKT